MTPMTRRSRTRRPAPATDISSPTWRPGIGALLRPPRSPAPVSPWQRYGRLLALGGVAIVLSMIFVDQAAIRAVAKLPVWMNRAFNEFTDFGLSGKFLYPLGILILLIAVIDAPWVVRGSRLVMAALVARLGFLFTAIALTGIVNTIVKNQIGRRRPSDLGPVHLPAVCVERGVRELSVRPHDDRLCGSGRFRGAVPALASRALGLCGPDRYEPGRCLEPLPKRRYRGCPAWGLWRALGAQLVCGTPARILCGAGSRGTAASRPILGASQNGCPALLR